MSRFAGWAFFLTISVSHDRQDEKRGTGHAVVAVRHEQHWPVLDNRTMVILDAENVRDYRPLFALDQNGTRAIATAAIDLTTNRESDLLWQRSSRRVRR